MSLVSDILRKHRTFAVVGVSQDPAKYGHEVFESLLAKGYTAYPINPKYEEIDGQPCYGSLNELPAKPEVVVTVVPPGVTAHIVESCIRLGFQTVWMPPGSWSEQALDACEASGINVVHDICLVFALRSVEPVAGDR